MLRKIKLSTLIYPIILLILLLLLSCDHNTKSENTKVNYNDQAAFNQNKDAEIQRYNLELKKKESVNRFPCDTIAVIEHIFDNYPAGTYLLEFDKTSTYNIPKPAIIYFTDKDGSKFIFTVIACSREGERLIEPANLVGYDQSFIDLDSTKLGTPFLYLVLFECRGENLIKQWEAPIPSHGGFNSIALKKWDYNGTYFIESNFHYAQGIGHINYNYFLIDNIRKFPHLLMTYEGTSMKRTLANVNNDKFPDYYEHVIYNLKDKVFSKDSVAFRWREKDTLYINTNNPKQTRHY
ncbi:MAG TPA: hypothetical protein PKE38_09830 [Ignavibacteriaceae bacterium]|mgnify:FL=1|nr:hypothetical protein [Ignavibacteriaceae bacterium]